MWVPQMLTKTFLMKNNNTKCNAKSLLSAISKASASQKPIFDKWKQTLTTSFMHLRFKERHSSKTPII